MSSSAKPLTVIVHGRFHADGMNEKDQPLPSGRHLEVFSSTSQGGKSVTHACPGGSAVSLKVNVLPVVSPSVTVSEVGSNVTPPVSSSRVFTDTVTASSASYSAAPVSSAGVSSSTS